MAFVWWSCRGSSQRGVRILYFCLMLGGHGNEGIIGWSDKCYLTWSIRWRPFFMGIAAWRVQWASSDLLAPSCCPNGHEILSKVMWQEVVANIVVEILTEEEVIIVYLFFSRASSTVRNDCHIISIDCALKERLGCIPYILLPMLGWRRQCQSRVSTSCVDRLILHAAFVRLCRLDTVLGQVVIASKTCWPLWFTIVDTSKPWWVRKVPRWLDLLHWEWRASNGESEAPTIPRIDIHKSF